MDHSITLSRFLPKYSHAFSQLNEEWISKYFKIEDADRKQLNAPEGILEKGGQIFFAFNSEQPVGTCALIKHSGGIFELAKMAVTPDSQGLGIGSRLYDFAETWAIENKARKIILSSNTVLTPALTLYEKKGFVRLNKKIETEYDRCNVQYEKSLVNKPTIH